MFGVNLVKLSGLDDLYKPIFEGVEETEKMCFSAIAILNL